MLQEVGAAFTAQHDVGDECVELEARVCDHLPSVGECGGGEHSIAAGLQHSLCGFAHGALVVDHEHAMYGNGS